MRRRITILAAMLAIASALVISSIASNRRATAEKETRKGAPARPQEPHTIKVTPWGPDQETIDATKSQLTKQPALAPYLKGKRYRLIAFDFVESAVKTDNPEPPSRYRATFFDYTGNRVVLAEGRFNDPKVAVSLSLEQPMPNPEEFDAAVEVVAQDPTFGPALRDGTLQAYPPMPPLADINLTTSQVERTVTVGLMPQGGALKSEIVGVNMIRQSLIRYAKGAPPTSNAVTVNCGVTNANQTTTGNGTAGQFQVTISRGTDVIWEFLLIRPSASSGNNRSGIELQNVKFRGKLVMSRGNMPVLNVQYYRNACGPFRDWLWQEGQFVAAGTPLVGTTSSGILLCTSEPQTVIDNGTDTGNFRGVAIWDRETVSLVSELNAGWYRYISKWTFDDNGIISPRFGFGAVSNGCVCLGHVHHAYWRFDLDVLTAGGNSVAEFYQNSLKTVETESMRARLAPDQYWQVRNTLGGAAVIIRPRSEDGNYDKYGHGDVWLVKSHFPSEIDDSAFPGGSDCHVDGMLNNESILNQDIVVWYGAHYIHESFDLPPGDLSQHLIGPDLILSGY